MRKIIARSIIVFWLGTTFAHALLPLIPLGFGLALTGSTASSLILPITAASIAVGAGLAYVSLGGTTGSSLVSQPIIAQISPTEPLPTPSGYTAPVPPSVTPTPPSTAAAPVAQYTHGSLPGQTFSSPTALRLAYINLPFNAPAASWGLTACTLNNSTLAWFCLQSYPGVGTTTLTGTGANTCAAGYTASGGNCNLTNASIVIKPSDGSCTIVRTGNTFAGDPLDPDCNVLPSGVTVTGGTVTVKPTATETQKIVANADGTATITNSTQNSNNTTTTSTINVSASSGVGTAKITGISTGTVNGTGDLAGTGAVPAEKLPTDYNREATQASILSKLGEIKNAQCGGTGQPKCETKVDETGTPTATGNNTAGNAALDAAKDAATAAVASAASPSGKDFSFTFFSVIPSVTCQPYPLWNSITLNLCPALATLKTILAFCFALTTCWLCLGMVGSTLRG